MGSEFQGLLPSSFEQFRSVEFWDGFFKKRQQRPFEWYGEWAQLRPLLEPLLGPAARVLVPGCGNSELSAQVYDSGIRNITNVDFSKVCIREMMLKNLRQRPVMKWLVMDMTCMTFPDGAFDAVVDKGGLDALMGEDTPEGGRAGAALLTEASRVLSSEAGVYACITLAQSHVLRLLLEFFGPGWRIQLLRVPPSPDMAASPLQPLLAVARRDPEVGGRAPGVELVGIDADSRAPNAEQLQEVVQLIQEENALRAAGGREQQPPIAGPATPAQDSASSLDPFAAIHPGQRREVPLPRPANGKSDAGGEEARFTAVVLDVGEGVPTARECAVFLVPQGREHEWLFSAPAGQAAVAEGCAARRVILVSLNRGHAFAGMDDVKAELSPLVLPLAPAAARGVAGAIPFMTTDDGIGSRTVLEQAESELSGRIIVEDVTLRTSQASGSARRAGVGGSSVTLRRMVFAANRNLVQSEAFLERGPAAPAAGGGREEASGPAGQEASGTGGGVGGRKSKQKGSGRQAGTRKPNQAPAPAAGPWQVDPTRLACDYHKAIVAGLSLAGDGPGDRKLAAGTAPAPTKVLVVGLGGGGLPMYCHRVLGLDVEVVELDPTVLALAQRHFGFSEIPGLRCRIGDGLAAVAAAAEEASGQLDVLVVDAGSGDASLAMSCPPPPFLEGTFLEAASRCLAEGSGLLVVNCVCRAEEPYRAAVQAVKAHFAAVYELDVEEDVNRVLLARRAPLPLAGAARPDGSAAAVKALLPRLKRLAPQPGALAHLLEHIRQL